MLRLLNLTHDGIPRLFVLAGVLLGLPYALFIGPLHVPDEAGHLYRAYQASRGFCKGRPGIGAAIDMRQEDRMPWIELPRGTTGKDMLRLVDSPQGGTYDVISVLSAVNLYSCVAYIPAASALWAGRMVGASPLGLMYLGRLVNLGVYIGLVFLALRLLPDWRMPMAALAVMPMALQQAASLSIDSITIGLSFVVTSYVLKLAFDKEVLHVEPYQHTILGLGLVLLALCKASAGLVLLTVIIPKAKFSGRFGRWLAVSSYIALSLGVMLLWQFVNGSNDEIFATLKGAVGVHVTANVLQILRSPFGFLVAVAHTILVTRSDLLEEFIGKLGWLDTRLPQWVILGYPVILVLAAAVPASRIRLSSGQRALLFLVCAINVVLVFAVVGVTWEPFTAPLRNNILLGMQGRYLIPFAFPGLMILALGGVRVLAKPFAGVGLVFVIATHLMAWDVVWNTFQARTSTIPNRIQMALHGIGKGSNKMATLYQGRLVSLHGVSGQGQPMFLVDSGARHLLEDHAWMARKGYRWPDDVVFVPAAVLDAVPLGEPVRRVTRGQSSPTGSLSLSNEEIRQQESIVFGGLPGDVPVVGDWNGDGRTKKGIFRNGTWWLDWDGDGHHTIKDKVYQFGGLPNDLPVTGDWNGDGRTKIGVYRGGTWLLDFNGNGTFDGPTVDRVFSFGGVPGDIPITGDWNADGKTEIGLFRLGRLWILDANGNGAFDGTGSGKDLVFPFGGIAGDVPVVGDWNGDGKTNVGVFRHDHYWILDVNGNANFDGVGPGKDRAFLFGKVSDDIPVVGDWNGDGKSKVGVVRKGRWILDVDGSGREDP